MLCPNCGSENKEQAKFCENCGAPLAGVAGQGQTAQPASVPPAVGTASVADSPEPPAPRPPAASAPAQAAPVPPPPPNAAATEQSQTEAKTAPAQTPPPPAPASPMGDAAPQPTSSQTVPPPPVPPMPQTAASASASGPATPPQAVSSGKAVGALVCGILAIVFSPSVIFGIILGIVALVLASSAGKIAPDGKSKAGKVCGIIGIIISAIILIFSIVTGVALFKYIEENPEVLSTSSSSSITIPRSSSEPSFSSNSASTSSSAQPGTSASNGTAMPSGKLTAPTVYANNKYGWSLTVPTGFEFITDDEDSAMFADLAADMWIIAMAIDNTFGLTLQDVEDGYKSEYADAQVESHDGYLVIKASEDDETVVYLIAVGTGSIQEVYVTYPKKADDAASYAIAKDILNSFRVADLATSHS